MSSPLGLFRCCHEAWVGYAFDRVGPATVDAEVLELAGDILSFKSVVKIRTWNTVSQS